MIRTMYEYSARVIRVVDGDTVDLAVDLGFGIVRSDRFRLLGINAPERRGSDRDLGERATARLAALLGGASGGSVLVLTVKDRREKYGRYLARVLVPQPDGDVVDVGARLLAEGLAQPVP